MDVRATLRASPGKQGARPTKDRLEHIAAELRDTGFEVLRVGRRGVVVSGDEERFTRILGVNPGTKAVQTVRSSSSKLGDLVDLVEFVPEPDVF